MKITVDIDCTPDEARRFLGLPDVAELQKEMMTQLQDKMIAAITAQDAESLMRTWMPNGIKGFEDMQKQFWQNMMGQAGKPSGKAE